MSVWTAFKTFVVKNYHLVYQILCINVLWMTLCKNGSCHIDWLWSVFLISSTEHEVLMVSYCGQSMSVVRRAVSTIALKAYSSYTPGTVDSTLGRKHRGDL